MKKGPGGNDDRCMSHFVLRQIHPPGFTASEHSPAELLAAILNGEPVEGKFLAWFDVEAYGGRGADRWTDDVRKAIRFKSFEAAMACWQQTSKTVPLRTDGRPNRPLTAYSVTVQEVDVSFNVIRRPRA